MRNDVQIGTTMQFKDNVVPEHVQGYIGCGFSNIELDETEMDFAKLDTVIREQVPTGFYNYIEPKYAFSHHVNEFICKEKFGKGKIAKGLTTLGEGNYFIGVSRNTKGRLVLPIHRAYKNIDDILENIEDTVDVLEVIKLVYNFKSIKKPFGLKN